jgi:importin-4
MADPNAAAALAAVAHVANLLNALTQPDTNTIRQAELALKPVLKDPTSMQLLWQIITNTSADATNPNAIAVRHVAAIVLRKRLPGHYSTWDDAIKLQWQNQILQGLAIEQVRPVRAGLIGVAAAIALVEQNATQPFLQFLSAAANDGTPIGREICFLLLNEMTDTIGLHWKEHLQALSQLYTSSLHNTSEDISVHKAAVQSLGQLMSFWAEEAEIETLAPLLPVFLQVASRSAASTTSVGTFDEDFLATVLDILYDLAYSSAPALQGHMSVTIEFCLSILRNRDMELRVRDAAALVIATTAEAKPKSFGRATKLLGDCLDTLFQLMQDSSESAAGALFESNPAWRADLIDEGIGSADDHDDDDFDNPTETSMAQGTLDMLACEIPKKYIWKLCLDRCLLLMSNTTDHSARKAGVAGLGVIAEGCCEPLSSQLQHVLPYVFKAAQDPHAQVRECACFCLGQISEHCQPDILQFSEQILPIVFQLLDDRSVAVQATSCYVLEMFCERLEPTAVRPLLDSLVRKLAAMLEATTKRSVQEMAVAALAATAVAAEEEFTPYVQGVAELMTKLMAIQDPSLHSLRGRALECMGHMAIAVGKETFRPYFPPTMQCALEGLTMDSTDLQEFAYAVFANLAKVMQEDFAPALPDLVPFLIQVIDQDEGQLEAPGDDDEDGEGFKALDDSDDEDDDAEGGKNMVLHVRTALLDVKKGAITALGEMAAHTGTSFCPYLEQSMQILQKAATNWHPIIKAEVAEALPSLIVPSIAAYHNGEIEWKKGDIHTTTTLSAHTVAITTAVLKEELQLMRSEEKSVVAKACEAYQSIIELTGPQALMPTINESLTATHELLIKVAPCHNEEGMYGEVPDDDDDHDVVMQAACDLIGGYCRVIGKQFKSYLPQFLPAICEYGKPSRPAADRAMAVGCLSEIAQELEEEIADYWTTVFFPAILSGLSDEEDNVKRNAAFCAGICSEHLPISQHYPEILQRLGPIFAQQGADENEATMACIDNAAAAVARMIMASPASVPLQQVLPAFLSVLPLKTDMTENDTVYNCILGLPPDALQPFMNDIRRIFTEVCSDDSKVDDELKARLRNAQQQ